MTMIRPLSALLLCGFLVCGREAQAQAVLPYNPIMASFSNELDFDALRGPVKEFEQVMYDSNRLPLMIARASFDASGCLTRYEKIDNTTQKQLNLIRDNDLHALISRNNPDEKITLSDRCHIIGTQGIGDDGRLYIYQKDLLVKVKDAHDGYVYKEYFYTPEAMPKSVVWYGDESDILLITEPKKKLSDPWDFVTQGYNNGTLVYRTAKKCQYDGHANPMECILGVKSAIDGDKEENKIQGISYAITYYDPSAKGKNP